MKATLAITAVVCFMFAATASAEPAAAPANDEAQVVDLKTVTCRDFLRAGDQEQSDLLIFLHGYFSGKKGDATINAGKLAEVSDDVFEACIDNPASVLFSVVEEKRK